MKVLATVLSANNRKHKDKMVCDVALQMGNELAMATLWNNKVLEGADQKAKEAVGRQCLLDLQVEPGNNGKLRWSFGFEVDFSEVNIRYGSQPQVAKAS